jgi:surface protein
MGCGPGPIILTGNFIYFAKTEPTQESHLPIVNKEGSFVKLKYKAEKIPDSADNYEWKVTIRFEFNACTTSLEDGANFKNNTDIVIVDYDGIPLARTGGSGRQWQGFEGKIQTDAGVPTILEGTDLSYAFKNVKLNSVDFGNLANLDTKNVTNMKGMFNLAKNFNQDISNWNMVNVTDTSEMFSGYDYEETGFTSVDMVFNQPLDSWNISNVRTMRDMFTDALKFNQPLDSWNTANVRDMGVMFFGYYDLETDQYISAFNQPLNSWNTANVTYMGVMFGGATKFNQSLDSWNTSNVTIMESMFDNADAFNQSLDSWDTANVTDMSFMFNFATSFNQPLDSWNTSNVTYIVGMFWDATKFNQPLNSWNISNVTSMVLVFSDATKFNQPLDSWNTANARDMGGMFYKTPFNQPLNSWNTSNVKTMSFAGYGMFEDAKLFNQDISMWNVEAVEFMQYMFKGATKFNCLDTIPPRGPNGNIRKWKVSGNTNVDTMFANSKAMNDTYNGAPGYDATTGTPIIETFFGQP